MPNRRWSELVFENQSNLHFNTEHAMGRRAWLVIYESYRWLQKGTAKRCFDSCCIMRVHQSFTRVHLYPMCTTVVLLPTHYPTHPPTHPPTHAPTHLEERGEVIVAEEHTQLVVLALLLKAEQAARSSRGRTDGRGACQDCGIHRKMQHRQACY